VVGETTGADRTAVAILAPRRTSLALATRRTGVSPGAAGEAVHEVVGIARRTASETLRAVLVSRLLDVPDLALPGVASAGSVDIATVAVSRAEPAPAGRRRLCVVDKSSESLGAGERERWVGA
jgi:hypothetical protein